MQSSSLKTCCFYSFINDVLTSAIEKYELDIEEAAYLKSIYFFRSYALRAENNSLEEDTTLIAFQDLKSFSRECIELFKKEYDKHISHQYVISQFQKKLGIPNQREINIVFKLNCLNLKINNSIKVDNYFGFDEKIYKNAHYILNRFHVNNMPVELYIVLLYDIFLTYLANDDIAHEINSQFMHEIITGQIVTIGKKIFIDDNSMTRLLQHPPVKKDFSYNMRLNVFNASGALELLVLFMGNEAWYQQFDTYQNENCDEYFSFLQEPYFSLVKNTRSEECKNISLDTTIENFLSNEYREKFFRLWQYRFHKNEKLFFNKYIKPKILNKENEIEFEFSAYKGLDIKSILTGIMLTSSFSYEYQEVFGSVSVVTKVNECTNRMTLYLNKDLYKNI